jgi:hypothetical protein
MVWRMGRFFRSLMRWRAGSQWLEGYGGITQGGRREGSGKEHGGHRRVQGGGLMAGAGAEAQGGFIVGR